MNPLNIEAKSRATPPPMDSTPISWQEALLPLSPDCTGQERAVQILKALAPSLMIIAFEEGRQITPAEIIQALKDPKCQFLNQQGGGACCDAFKIELQGQAVVLKIQGGAFLRPTKEHEIESAQAMFSLEPAALEREQARIHKMGGLPRFIAKGVLPAPANEPDKDGTQDTILILEQYVHGPKLTDAVRGGLVTPEEAKKTLRERVCSFYSHGEAFWDIDPGSFRLACDQDGKLIRDQSGRPMLILVDAGSLAPQKIAAYPEMEQAIKVLETIMENNLLPKPTPSFSK